MSTTYGSPYYWFAILFMTVIAITIWCWKCHKQSQQRQEQVLARNLQVLQVQIQREEPPSNYQPDSPPAYDDVINKPDDYPVYHEESTTTSLPSRPEDSNVLNEAQHLPSYQEAVHLSGNFTDDAPVVSPEPQVNVANQSEQRTCEPDAR